MQIMKLYVFINLCGKLFKFTSTKMKKKKFSYQMKQKAHFVDYISILKIQK